MKSVLMIFIDGVGIGKKDYVNNPFFKYDFKIFKELFGEIPHLGKQRLTGRNSYLFPVDATMGVPDIPLSGTGQTSIFCGVNAPKIIGKHFGPYPYSTLVPIIKEKNIFIELKRKRKKVTFVNAYPKQFFDYVKKGRRMLSVTTLSCLLSGVKLNKISDVHKGRALSADIDNYRFVNKMNYKLKVITPELAAKRLVRIASSNHFTLFEYFHTDHLGHGRNLELFDLTVKTLDGFLHSLVKILPDEMTLLICSDHGNFEDLTVRTHTLNPALGLTYGKYAERIASKIKSLYDIKDSLMELYE